jgi:hypothetical protein
VLPVEVQLAVTEVVGGLEPISPSSSLPSLERSLGRALGEESIPVSSVSAVAPSDG